jgi:tetratricopeptide (TPR) repeat protein
MAFTLAQDEGFSEERYPGIVSVLEAGIQQANIDGDVELEKRRLDELGNLHLSARKLDAAAHAFERQLNRAPNGLDRAKALTNLGQAHALLGQHSRSVQVYEEGLSILRGTQGGIHPFDVAKISSNLAASYLALGRLDKVQEIRNLGIALDPQVEAVLLSKQGKLLESAQKLEEFVTALSQKNQTTEVLRQMSNTYGNLGLLYKNMEMYAESVDRHQKAIKIAEENGYTDALMQAYSRLGETVRRQGKYKQAINLFESALCMAKKLGDTKAEAIQYGSIGNTYVHAGECAPPALLTID